MIAPAVLFLASACLFLITVIASGVLVFTDTDDSRAWFHLMRWMRVSVALGVVTGVLTLLALTLR